MTEEEQQRLPASSVDKRLPTVVGSHVPDANDDTIELPLAEEEMLALSQAAEEECARTGSRNSALIAAGTLLRNLTLGFRTHRWSLVLASSVLGIGTCVALGVVLAGRISTETISEPPPAQSAESLQPPVRFGNPFDASEVFEFPPGTSVDQARESVAAMLLQRARERQVMGIVRSKRAMPVTAADHARVAQNSDPPPVSSWH